MRVRKTKIRMNAGALKPIAEITDRAKRYRANRPGVRPGPPKQCNLCGKKKTAEVDHINGNEADDSPDNLWWLCRSCNTAKGILFKKNGLGIRTEQFNPPYPPFSAGRKLPKKVSMDDYGVAIKVMRGYFDGDVAAAMRTIRATPAAQRSAYNRKVWGFRKKLYGRSGRSQSEIPF